MKRLNVVIRMLGLKKHSMPGMGDCQILSVCLAYFGVKNYNELDSNKSMTKLKWFMINKHENEDLVGNLEHKFLHWRRHAIGCCLPNSL